MRATVCFRVDAGISMGNGHLMRCITLAHALAKQGFHCQFICRPLPEKLLQWLQAQYPVQQLAPDIIEQFSDARACVALLNLPVDLLVVDHYQLAAPFEQSLRSRCRFIMVIDDLANRQHDCDLLLDQNMYPDQHTRYLQRVPDHCCTLLGPGFALLRDEFYQSRPAANRNRLLINFGATDPDNLTMLAISALELLKFECPPTDIVVGATNPWQAEIAHAVRLLPNVQLHIECAYMATLMQSARLMLGSGGATHWERCYCALPALVVTVAENQLATTVYLAKLGACVWLGQASDMSASYFAERLRFYLAQPTLLNNISKNASVLLPATGGTAAVVKHLLKLFRGINVSN